MTPVPPVVHSDPDILGGTPVFVGTRVPLRALIDYLGGGQPLSVFLEDFPTVSRDQAVTALQLAAQALVADARPA
ncbi:MAG TPA: DUF433 domain-containing protein [Fimbriiglobus sp.]|nr:DUF433 domain-containing protein [Fimbriiglobus sp.]